MERGPECESVCVFPSEVGRCGLREDSFLCVSVARWAAADGGQSLLSVSAEPEWPALTFPVKLGLRLG